MILTNKAKEDFKEWVFENYYFQDLNVLYPLHLIDALIIEWFDSVGIYIEIIRNEGSFDYVVGERWDYGFDTRQDATTQAIKKANEIYNVQYYKQKQAK